MGSIRVRDGNPRPFQARVYDPDGKLVSKSFTTRKGAQRWIAVKQREVDQGQYIDHRAGDRKFGWYADGCDVSPG